MPPEIETRSLTPGLPTYREARHFIRILDGVPYQRYRDAYDAIWSQRGTPQNQMDWTDPDVWISARLEGAEQTLAARIWRESEGKLNPRYLRGCWYFSQTHALLQEDGSGILRLSERGRQFLNGKEALVAEIDRYEGVFAILDIIAQAGSGQVGDFLPSYTVFCHTYTGYRRESPIKSSLRDRLQNLLDRDYLVRSQYIYALSEAGQAYRSRHPSLLEPLPDTVPAAASDSPEAPPPQRETRSLTPGLPLYRVARHFLRIMDGESATLYHSTNNAIREHRGSPQEQVDWTNPDEWIPNRLSGPERELAHRLWQKSNHELNPRHMRGAWYLTTKHQLLQTGADGRLSISERGRRFLSEEVGEVVGEIDAYEGILTALRLVAERGPGKRSDFLPAYTEFCRTHTGYQSEAPIRGALYERLTNLIDRDYVDRSGQVYEVTDAGLTFMERYGNLVAGQSEETHDTQSELRRLRKRINREVREQLAEYLGNMDPFKFEHLIQFLLEEMGYRDVETTSPTNDKGVDVIADIDLGISSAREVVQVKRYQGNVGRRVLDQLRGSLHRFNAVRGTIITTGGFTRGTKQAAFEHGAAPIALIDGEKLLDLLIEHGIGVSKQTIDYLEFDVSKLTQFEAGEEGI